MKNAVRFFAALSIIALAHNPSITERVGNAPTYRVMQHLKPLTMTLKGGIKVGVVQIPLDVVQVEQHGAMTIVTTEPSNFGVGITIPWRSDGK